MYVAGSEEPTRHTSERLQTVRLFFYLEYTFKHALTHVVVYDSLSPEQRRPVHATVLEAIERTYQDRRAEHVE
jgi:hypothetical protein